MPPEEVAQPENPAAAADASIVADPPPANAVEPGLLGRMLAFIALATAADLWLEHHLGVGVGDPKILGALGASLAVAMGLLDRVAEKAEREALRAWLRRWIRPVLAPRVLAVLSLLAALFALSYSSLTVLPEAGAGTFTATITASDDASYTVTKTAGAAGQALRFPLQVTAFGRSFEVQADGYLSRRFEVRPLGGLRVQAGSDLTPLPSLLLRPPPAALRSLLGRGKFALVKLQSEQRVQVIDPIGGATSLLVGRPRPLPSSLAGQWRLELAAAGMDEVLLARTLLQWSSPQLVQPRVQILPGDRLEATVLSGAGKVIARAMIIVGDEKLADVGLIGVAE